MANAEQRVFDEKELRSAYGTFFERGAHHQLDPEKVPEGLRPLIPYAAFWGVADDPERDGLVDDAATPILENLVFVWRLFRKPLYEFLTVPVGERPKATQEWAAVAYMERAADVAAIELQRRRERETERRVKA